MKITSDDQMRAKDYHNSEPKQFGNLHQRMRFALEIARRDGVWNSLPELWQALHDLELEVSYHEPAEPPFGRRFITLGTADRSTAVVSPAVPAKAGGGPQVGIHVTNEEKYGRRCE